MSEPVEHTSIPGLTAGEATTETSDRSQMTCSLCGPCSAHTARGHTVKIQEIRDYACVLAAPPAWR
jgi:hypothetical protein